MKTLLTRRTIIIAAVAVLIAVTSIISINVFNTSGPVTGLANTISRPLRALTSIVARTFESIYSSIYKYDGLMEDYEKVLRELTELRADSREVEDLREENDRLRELVDFRKRHGGFESEDAMVVGRTGSNWSSSFTIDRGYANSNIERGNAVVTAYGVLIGQVSEVNAIDSIVVTVLDTTFSAGVFVGESDSSVPAKGDFTLMRSGLLMLDRLPASLVVLPGNTVVTSGYGSVLPPGLVVGEIVEVLRHNTGIGLYATVKPMRDVDTISQVFIITGFETTDEEISDEE